MGTRSVIARPTPEGGFTGTYCHYDGYPAHQGRLLHDAVSGHFDGDPDAACRYLIDQHPAGWSVLHGDFAAPPGYRHRGDPEDLRNQCYCHGDRHDPPRPPLTQQTARAAWIDYAYIIGPERLQVLTDLEGGWQPIAEPAWTDSPDWDAIDTHARRVRAEDGRDPNPTAADRCRPLGHPRCCNGHRAATGNPATTRGPARPTRRYGPATTGSPSCVAGVRRRPPGAELEMQPDRS